MKKHDYIIIGTGMGGLSVANFLAMQGKRVLVLEKHDKPGGLVTSFSRKGLSFDIGLESLAELNEDDSIQQFMQFWGQCVPVIKHNQNIRCYIDGKQYYLRHDSLVADLIRYFPDNAGEIETLFSINKKMLDEMLSDNKAPVPPYDMNFFQLIMFGIKNAIQKPTFMKYGLKNYDVVIDKITKNPVIATIFFSKIMSNIVYMGYAYMWENVRRNKLLYPLGGMQAIPDRAVAALNHHGGEIMLNTEVTKIIVKNDKACGVICEDGNEYYADYIISNASPHFTYKLLPDDIVKKYKLMKRIEKKKIFPSESIIFMGIKSAYGFKGATNINIISTQAYQLESKAYTPHNCPISLIISYKQSGQKDQSVTVVAPLPYSYKNNWNTKDNGERTYQYKETKKEVLKILLERLYNALGENFREAILFAELSTPITFERYTYSKEGSPMGWAIDSANYGKFLKQSTNLPNLFLVGQWVFPGFGVAGVMASGYYLAKDLLKQSDIDLEMQFKSYHDGKKD